MFDENDCSPARTKFAETPREHWRYSKDFCHINYGYPKKILTEAEKNEFNKKSKVLEKYNRKYKKFQKRNSFKVLVCRIWAFIIRDV